MFKYVSAPAVVLVALFYSSMALAEWADEESPVTSIKQVKDVKADLEGYTELSDLYDNYQSFGTNDAGNFRPKDKLTNAAWAVWLNNSATTLSQHVNDAAAGLDEKQVDEITKMLPSSYEKDAPTSVSQVTDLKKTDPYYEAVQSLVERFAIHITDSRRNLNPDSTLKPADLAIVLKGALRYDGPLPTGEAPMTRIEVAVYLDKALVHYDKLIKAKVAELKQKKK